jgi:hypothetical protein
LGDYLKQLRGRIFSYPVLSIPLQFKQYVVSTVFLQGRALQMGFGKPLGEWVNGKFKVLDPELESVKKQFELDKIPPAEIESRLNQIEEYRKELYRQARKATYGMWGMAFLWGGAAATPFFSSIGLVLGAAFAGDDDEDEDKEFLHSNWENDFYRWMQRTFGGAIGATLVKGGVEKDTAQNIGEAIGRATARGVIPELTGASLSERITTDPLAMLWREGRYTKDPRGQILEDVAGNIAGVSLGLNFADAYKLWGQGKKGLAVEKMLPSLFAAPLKSYRLGKEGMTDSNGVVINLMYADEFSKWDVALKAIGISPEREVMARRMASKTVQEQQEIEDQYNNLMNRLFLERSHLGTDEGEEKALEKLQKFIEVYPDLEKNVEKGLEDRAESAAMAEAIGAKLPEKYIPRLSEKLDYVKSRAKPEPKFNPKAFLEK